MCKLLGMRVINLPPDELPRSKYSAAASLCGWGMWIKVPFFVYGRDIVDTTSGVLLVVIFLTFIKGNFDNGFTSSSYLSPLFG
jgi:hypothetical protein